MKWNRLFALLLAAMSVSLLQGEEIKIGVVLRGRSPFWLSVEEGIKAAAAKYSAEAVIKAPRDETDVGSQIQFINALGAQGLKVIVVAPNSPEALKVPLAALKIKGVKLVVLDSPVAENIEDVFVATDHQAYGAAEGELVGQLIAGSGEVAIFKHNQTSLSTRAREEAAMAKIRAAAPNARIHSDFYASSVPGAEHERALALIEKHPTVGAILCSATPGTMAMLKAVEEKGLGGKVKLIGSGFNLPPEIVAALQNGHLHGWAAQRPREIGSSGFEAAVRLHKGESVPKEIKTGFVLVTPANLESAEAQELRK